MPCDWLFIDGSSLIFRAFYAMPDSVRAPDGRPVNAVRGFIETLGRLVTNRRPRRLAVASDADWRPAWRVELLPTYKAHRVAEPIPPGLIPQMPVIDEILTAIGVNFAGVAEYEAEDVIATWTAQAKGTVEIASGDRDLFALIEDSRIVVLYPEKSGLSVIDEAEVARRYGIPRRRYADFAVLRGDPSDGLPGLKRVGAVAAAALVHKFGSLEGVIENGALADADRDYLQRAMRAVPPVRDLPIQLPEGRRASYPADAVQLAALTKQYNVQAAGDRLVAALNSNRGE